MELLHLYQVALWIESKLSIPQQIVHTKNKNIRYHDHEEPHDPTHMTLIVDADLDIRSVSWSEEYGLGLNVEYPSNANHSKSHVLLWTDSELRENEHGFYMDAIGALNGLLIIQNPRVKLTEDIISEMLSMPKSEDKKLHPLFRLSPKAKTTANENNTTKAKPKPCAVRMLKRLLR